MIHVSQKILCIDDDAEIRDLLRHQLRDGYDCVFAESGEEGLALLHAEGPFAVAVVDYKMPGMSGIELLQELHTRSPDTVSMMLTAYDDLEVAIEALHRGHIFRFLRKPWDAGVLRQSIDDALEQYRVVVTERMLASALADANKNLKKKLEQLQDMNQLMEYWVEFSPAVIYSLNIDNGERRPSYVSKNFPRLTGYERTELIVDPGFWMQHIHPDDREHVRREFEEVLDTTEDQHALEYRLRRADGEYRNIYDSFRVVRGRAGEPLEVVGAWLDVTDRAPA